MQPSRKCLGTEAVGPHQGQRRKRRAKRPDIGQKPTKLFATSNRLPTAAVHICALLSTVSRMARGLPLPVTGDHQLANPDAELDRRADQQVAVFRPLSASSRSAWASSGPSPKPNRSEDVQSGGRSSRNPVQVIAAKSEGAFGT